MDSTIQYGHISDDNLSEEENDIEKFSDCESDEMNDVINDVLKDNNAENAGNSQSDLFSREYIIEKLNPHSPDINENIAKTLST